MTGKVKSTAHQVSYRWVSETWNAGMTHATLEWQTRPSFCNSVHCTAQ